MGKQFERRLERILHLHEDIMPFSGGRASVRRGVRVAGMHETTRRPNMKAESSSAAVGCSECTLRETPRCRGQVACRDFWGQASVAPYSGLRPTADGWDCALHVSLDSHSTCSYRCLYCFSNNLMRDPNRKPSGGLRLGQTSLKALERWLAEGAGFGQRGRRLWTALREARERAGPLGGRPRAYPAPIQFGALGDPFDRIERHQGWTLRAMPLFAQAGQPVRFSTKGGDLLLTKPYQRAFSENARLFWCAFSCISPDDTALARVDLDAPSATERLRAMKALSHLGVKTSLRFRPALPGLSDSTPREPNAARTLVRRAAEAGASAVSFEVAFVPSAMPPHVRNMWVQVEAACGVPLRQWYRATSRGQHVGCLRSSRAWKEDITFAVREAAHECGLTFGISDPAWKELNDTGCCCGIKEDDPVFGSWFRDNATTALVEAKRTGRDIVGRDWIPAWAHDVDLQGMVMLSGPKAAMKAAFYSWADKLRETWNNLKSARGPLYYFEGALHPVGRTVEGDVIWQYVEPQRRAQDGVRTPYWNI